MCPAPAFGSMGLFPASCVWPVPPLPPPMGAPAQCLTGNAEVLPSTRAEYPDLFLPRSPPPPTGSLTVATPTGCTGHGSVLCTPPMGCVPLGKYMERPHTAPGGPPPPLDNPPPPQTKVTIAGRTEVYRWENLVGPFLVHKLLGPRPLPFSRGRENSAAKKSGEIFPRRNFGGTVPSFATAAEGKTGPGGGGGGCIKRGGGAQPASGGGCLPQPRWAVCTTGAGAHQGQTSREGEKHIWWTARTARGGIGHLGLTETQ